MREEDPQKRVDFATLYAQFHAPITELDCGRKCAPYNENGAPFCCDITHAVPTAYQEEWGYLEAATDLWHLWQARDDHEANQLRSITPENHVLIACRGYQECQRGFRSITCRSFPFFPYISEKDEFLGLTYYWEYEDRCWVISNLDAVRTKYRQEFINAYEMIFGDFPEEWENFRYHSEAMRDYFYEKRRSIPLLHRNGDNYHVSPRTGRLRRISTGGLPKFGVYKIAAKIPFGDEL